MGWESGFVNNKECLLGDNYLKDEDVIDFWCSAGRYFDDDILDIAKADTNADYVELNQDQILELIKVCDTYIKDNELVHVTPIQNGGTILVENDDGEAIEYNIGNGFWIEKAANFDYEKLNTYINLKDTLLKIRESGNTVWYYRSW